MTPVSAAVRGDLIEALKLDLVGPDNAHAFARELSPDAPSRWRSTTFLMSLEPAFAQEPDEAPSVRNAV